MVRPLDSRLRRIVDPRVSGIRGEAPVEGGASISYTQLEFLLELFWTCRYSDLQDQFGVLLGKGWHDDADPVIS